MTAPNAEQIVAGYMVRLERELREVDPAQRAELLSEVEGHIAEARAGLAQETDADLLNILDRLGSPAEVASEAAVGALDSHGGLIPESSPSARRDALRIAVSLLAWAGGLTSAIATLLVINETASLEVGALASLIAAVFGVAGGVLAFKNAYLAVAALVIASAVEGFALSLNGGQPLPVNDATGGALALLIAGAALAGVAAVLPRVRDSGRRTVDDPMHAHS